MCGILCILGIHSAGGAEAKRGVALKLSKSLRHRGPDWNGIYVSKKNNNILAHERLAIVGVENGAQPLLNEEGTLILSTNSEIYNFLSLRRELEAKGHRFLTQSDSEVILHAYAEHGSDMVQLLRGMFAFVLYDENTDTVVAGRDHIGIIPLYIGWGEDGSVWFASELKALTAHCPQFEEFPPGHVYVSTGGKWNKRTTTSRYYTPLWSQPKYMPTNPLDLGGLRNALEEAVVSHMMSDVAYGLLLSGGLDSSLVASIAARHKNKHEAEELHSARWWPQIHSFAIGLEGSPDLAAAQQVADFIGTIHHTIKFKVQEGLDALSDVIYHIESFDITTVRASTPMYLLARRIKSMGIKMVLSGEGADEIFGGYLYFHKAPNAEEFQAESVRKVFELNKYDCLRANKAMSAFGIEARVPFLDKNFLEYAMMIDPNAKLSGRAADGRIEKWLLRKAFDDQEHPYLPASILWRQKEQFSDGVGYSWIDSLKAYAESQISDAQMASAAERFPYNTPSTKEGYLYRQIFETHFPQQAAIACVPEQGFTVACSTAAVQKWDAMFARLSDPSGRAALGVHNQSYDEAKQDSE